MKKDRVDKVCGGVRDDVKKWEGKLERVSRGWLKGVRLKMEEDRRIID